MVEAHRNVLLLYPISVSSTKGNQRLPAFVPVRVSSPWLYQGTWKYPLCLHQISCQTHELSYMSTSSFLDLRTEIILIFSVRYVIIPDQCFSEIFPITRNLGTSLVFTGISIKSGSSHNSWAS